MPCKPKPLPPLSVLRELFSYDPETGAIIALTSHTTRRLGERCDGILPDGYRRVYIGSLYLAHRIAWAITYGEEPNGFIDHINRDRSDNRISNLRLATHRQNMCNRKAATHSKSGERGVHQRKENGKWRAYYAVNGKRKNVGTFDTFEQARDAVRTARKEAHGPFYRD